MSNTSFNLQSILSGAAKADINPLRSFLMESPEKPLIAAGSGAAECVADFAALLYGAGGGVSAAVSPYTLNSYSDSALKTSKVLLVSTSGHNNDIVFAAKRVLAVSQKNAASLTFSQSDRNEVRKLFAKAGSDRSFDIAGINVHDGFVATESPVAYFALLCRAFSPESDVEKYSHREGTSFRIERNDGEALSAEDLRGVNNFVILHGSWGRPVASSLEGKLVESGLAGATLCDYRNFCHGRFIYVSNHLEDSAVVLMVSPREKDIAGRIRTFLPAKTRLVIIETEEDSPEASLDLLIRSTDFFFGLCAETGTDYGCPSNPGKIDKRAPMWIPFTAEMKKRGPLAVRP